MQPQAPSQRPLLAALWMCGAIVSFSAMAVAGRALSADLDTFEIMTYRSAIGLIIMLTYLSAARRWSEISGRYFGRHLIRNLAHFTGQNLWFYSLPLIPLAQLFALEFTSPLWLILLAPIFLGERLDPLKLFAVGLGFAGILVVTRPGAAPISIGTITAASAAIAFALTNLFTKQLTRHETVAAILFFLTATQLIFGLIMAGWDGDMAVPGFGKLPWIVVVGLGGLTAHLSITTALTLAPASTVIPVDFARLPVIAVVGMLFYDEPLEWPVFAGALLIFVAIYLTLRPPQQRAKRPRSL